MRWLLLAFVVLCGPSAPAAAGYGEGVRAYDAGRYDDALKEFLPLSERGDRDAEFMLGAMYFYGKGVPRDDSLAAAWFHKAARQGHTGAQLAYGSLFVEGRGVLTDLVAAYMWLTVAAESSVPLIEQRALFLREFAAHSMTRDEIEEASRLARGWQPIAAGLAAEP